MNQFKKVMKYFIPLFSVAFLSCDFGDSERGLPDISKESLEGCFKNVSRDTIGCAIWCFDKNDNRYVHWSRDIGTLEQIQKYQIERHGRVSATGYFKETRFGDLENSSSEIFFVYVKSDTLFSRFEGSKLIDGSDSNFAPFVLVESSDICGKPFQLVNKPTDWYLK